MKLLSMVSSSLDWSQGCSLMLVQFAWRTSLAFAPWIRFDADPDYDAQWKSILDAMKKYEEEDVKLGRPRRPLFILANHTSFLDTILGVAKMPANALWRCRTYMSAHLFRMPVLSTVCTSIGHFPVHYKSGEDGAFKVDVEKMELVEKEVNKHIESGGWLCFFPEGQMNKSPETILPFRFGGMKRALQTDARLVSLVFRGNPKVWPRKAAVGGYPGKVRFSMIPFASNGARDFVTQCRDEGVAEDAEFEDHVLLSRRAQDIMQKQYDALASPSQMLKKD